MHVEQQQEASIEHDVSSSDGGKKQQHDENSIMLAVVRSDAQPDLIGDFSCNHALPLLSAAQAKKKDVKSISVHTVAALLQGRAPNARSHLHTPSLTHTHISPSFTVAGSLSFHQASTHQKWQATRLSTAAGRTNSTVDTC